MMLRRSILAAAIAATIAGCAPVPGDSYALYIDPAFNAKDFYDITAAADVWQTAAPVTFFQTRAACPGQYEHVICVVNNTDAVEAKEATFGGWELSAYTDQNHAGSDGSMVYVDATEIHKNAPALFQTIIEHELGHAMGQFEHRDPALGVTIMALMLKDDALKPTCNDVNDWLANRGRATQACPK